MARLSSAYGHNTTSTISGGSPMKPVSNMTAAATSLGSGKSNPPVDSTLLPKGSRDLSFIGLQAFVLGNVFTGCVLSTIYLAASASTWWRLPAFFTCLSLFHFLEYYVTARYNVPAVRASSFLLFSNGSAYSAAHALATVEIILSNLIPRYQALAFHPILVPTGIFLVLLGQSVRSRAMASAGTNFNHTVAKEHQESHTLVTQDVYHFLRHPSYFGFFWWALGTQILVGNKVCLLGYSVVLSRFFARRIIGEEKFLVRFFGQEYEDYRKRTPTYIPFVP